MRKDVRTGAVIGGLLIAVLILYGVVASRSHKKAPANPPVALGTENNTPDATGAPTPDAVPSAPEAAPTPTSPGDPAPSGGAYPGAAPATPPGGDSAGASGSSPDSPGANRGAATWAMLLSSDRVDNLMPSRTQTPDAPLMDIGSHETGARAPAAELPQPAPRFAAPSSGDSSPSPSPSSGSSPASSDGAPTVSSNYTVKSGDTLSSIARAAYGDARYYKKIMEANPKINPSRMRTGATITLPAKSALAHASTPSDSAVTANSPARHSSPAPAPSVDSATEYRVVSNDNLYKISMKLYHTPNKVDLIYQFNKTLIGADPAKLKLNMVLKLPEPPTQTASSR